MPRSREYPIPFKPLSDDAFRPVFGDSLPPRPGRESAKALRKELLGLAPVGKQFLYSTGYARTAFASTHPPDIQHFPDRTAWQTHITPPLAEWVQTAKAKATIANTIIGYYNTIGQFAIRLEGRDGLYLPNPSHGDERPLDYVGISPVEVVSHLYYERTHQGRHAYVPLLPDASGQNKGVLSLPHWNIPGIRTPDTQDSLMEAFEAAEPVTTPAGEISPLTMFCAGTIIVDEVAIPAAALFKDPY